MTTTAQAVADLKSGLENTSAAKRFSDADLEAVYALAYGVYKQGQYEKAASQFGFLTLYRPTNARFLKGLGACQFVQRAYAQAAGTYSFLVMLHPEDAEAVCLWGHALLLTGDKTRARLALARAIELPGASEATHARAKALLALLGR